MKKFFFFPGMEIRKVSARACWEVEDLFNTCKNRGYNLKNDLLCLLLEFSSFFIFPKQSSKEDAD